MTQAILPPLEQHSSESSVEYLLRCLDYVEELKKDGSKHAEMWENACNEMWAILPHLSPEVLQDQSSAIISFFQQCVTQWPTWGHVWRLYAEAVEILSGRDEAMKIYQHCLPWSHSLEFFISYVKCVYKEGHLLPLVDAVGMDIRSAPLWRELLALRIKLRNMRTRMDDVPHSERIYLLDPFLSYEKKNPESLKERFFTDDKLTLLVSAAQDLVATLPSIDEDVVSRDIQLQQLSKRLPSEQTFEKVRAVYRDWLATPTRRLKIVWEGYKQFEMAFSQNTVRAATSKILCTKILSTSRDTYHTSEKVYASLKQLMRHLYRVDTAFVDDITEIPPTPDTPHHQTSTKTLVAEWLNVLSYETSNPLGLSHTTFLHRIEGVFELCICSCAYESIIWMSYAQTLFSLSQMNQGLLCLQRCLDEFLPNDGNAVLRIDCMVAPLHPFRCVSRPDYVEFLLLVLTEMYHAEERYGDALKALIRYLIRYAKSDTELEKALIAGLRRGLPLSCENMWSPVLTQHECDSPSITNVEENEKAPLVAAETIVFLHLLNYVRTLTTATETHRFFLATHMLGPKELYLYYAQILWRSFRSVPNAKEILGLGLTRFASDKDYCEQYAHQLLEMGLVEDCRAFLLHSVSQIYNLRHAVPMRLWAKLFYVDKCFAPNRSKTIQERQTLLAQQLTGIDSQDRSLLHADDVLLTYYDNPQKTLPADIDEFQWPNTPQVSAALEAGIPSNRVSYSVLKNYGMKCRMLRCGGAYQDIYQDFSFTFNLFPKTSLTSYFSVSKKEDDEICTQRPVSNEKDGSLTGVPRLPKYDVITENEKLNTIDRLPSSSYISDSVKALCSSSTPSNSEQQKSEPCPTIVCPDTARMLPLHSLSKKGLVPFSGGQDFFFNDVHSVPKPLQLFSCLLPRVSQKHVNHGPLVEMILSTLPLSPVPSISIESYLPLPSSSQSTSSPQVTMTPCTHSRFDPTKTLPNSHGTRNLSPEPNRSNAARNTLKRSRQIRLLSEEA